MSNIYTLTPSQTKQAVEVALLADTPIFITGASGIGKSSIIKQIADEYKLQVIDVRLSQISQYDLIGYPKEIDGRMSYVPMDMLPIEGDPLPQGKEGFILFLDEYNSADKYVQGASYRLLLDREVGKYKLHPKCKIVMAGNRAVDNGLTNKLLAPIKTRTTHVEMIYNAKEFAEYVENQVAYGHWDALILGYIKFRPANVFNFDPKTINDVVTYATPRSWEMLSNQLKAGLLNVDPKAIQPIINGIVGEAAGNDFYSYLEVASSLPSIAEIEADPDNCPMPLDIGAQWALSSLLFNGVTPTNAPALAVYIERIENADIKVVIYRTLLVKCPSLVSVPLVQKSMGILKTKMGALKNVATAKLP